MSLLFHSSISPPVIRLTAIPGANHLLAIAPATVASVAFSWFAVGKAQARARFHGIFASNAPIAQMSVRPANVNPSPTNHAR